MGEWIDINDRIPSEYCYCLVSRKHYTGGDLSVHYSFFTPDREMAKKVHGLYSRKTQGKNSVHFSASESCFIITHWMEIPEPPKDLK